jgi:glycerate 2-kinase
VKVLIAPDSFKGSISNVNAAAAIAEGWLSLRPEDEVIQKAMADGGEGTLETISIQNPKALRISCNLAHESFWLLLSDATAYVELASICGLTLQSTLNPMSANTFEFGKVLRDIASDERVNRIVLSVGGSASTDGGAGLLLALGARLEGADGEEIERGGEGLIRLSKLDMSGVIQPPPSGVTCLSDVTNPLLGPSGSAAIYSPQKGANPEQVAELARGLERLYEVSGKPDFPGAGAAGGTPYGLSIAWDLSIESGALAIATLVGLPESIQEADLVITGEGRLDLQSAYGKVVGTITELAKSAGKEILYCVGSSEIELGELGVALIDIAPSLNDAISDPRRWLIQAGRELALRVEN